MSTIVKTSILCALLAACAVPAAAVRAPQVPPRGVDVPKVDLAREQAARASTDTSPSVASTEPSLPLTLFTPPTYRTVVHYVEVPVGAPEATNAAGGEVVSSDVYPAYVDYYRRDGHRWRGPYFPVNTAFGAGIGALIGHQSRHRGRGALIGGSIGLLLDIGRWWR